MKTASRTLFASLAALLVTAGLGCSNADPASDESAVKECTGAKADAAGRCRINGRFAPAACCAAAVPEVNLSCDVVELGASDLEEGFGSYYDIDIDGFSTSDEDAEDIDVQSEPGGLSMSLGHHSWSPEDGDRVESVGDAEIQEYVLRPSGSQEKYTVRVFANKLGVVLHEDTPESGSDRLGTLDCRNLLDDDPAEMDVTKMDHCNVVWVDASLNGATLEEGLGSIYDLDDDGFPQADEDATNVDLVSEPGKREVDIGHHGFSEADGDVIDVQDADDFVTYVIRPKGNPEVFSVRIFRAANDAEIPGIGVVIYQKTASSPEQQLAVLDCRGIEAPDLL